MINRIRSWFVHAVADGGGLLIVVMILLAGAGGAAVRQPIDSLFQGAAREPVAVSPADTSIYQCPDATWTRTSGFVADLGSTYTTCSKNKMVIRHFDRVTAGVDQDQAMDTSVYPHEQITVSEAVRRAH